MIIFVIATILWKHKIRDKNNMIIAKLHHHSNIFGQYEKKKKTFVQQGCIKLIKSDSKASMPVWEQHLYPDTTPHSTKLSHFSWRHDVLRWRIEMKSPCLHTCAVNHSLIHATVQINTNSASHPTSWETTNTNWYGSMQIHVCIYSHIHVSHQECAWQACLMPSNQIK